MLRRLNDLPIFDPGRVPGREVLSRIIGCVAITAFVLRRILQMPDWPGYIREVDWARPWFARLYFLPGFLTKAPVDLDAWYPQFGYAHGQIRTLWTLELLVWVVETSILLAYVFALLTRSRAQAVARGFMQTVFPLLLAGLPFTIVMTNYTYRDWFPERSQLHLSGLYGANAVLIAGGALNVIGLLTLRRGFTIMTEARVFVRSGLYRWVRHPLYVSHFVIYLVYTLLHFHPATAALYAAFVAGQTLRARNEERKMAEVFPEYEEYRRTTGMFFPRVWGGASSSKHQESRPDSSRDA
ncbi:MAG: isoprenylcysteine carboxylmethyltransferase family protein [Planctomycetes bacterium]|nr:isoprenylcysteine carboxylmethyltransferase family protein [Planctomycetota bacterium]